MGKKKSPKLCLGYESGTCGLEHKFQGHYYNELQRVLDLRKEAGMLVWETVLMTQGKWFNEEEDANFKAAWEKSEQHPSSYLNVKVIFLS